jgi:hypothetical protein
VLWIRWITSHVLVLTVCVGIVMLVVGLVLHTPWIAAIGMGLVVTGVCTALYFWFFEGLERLVERWFSKRGNS